MRLLLALAAAGLTIGAASAQTTMSPAAPATTAAPGTTAPATTAAPATQMSPTMPGAGIVNRNTGTAAASGDRNQVVATTTANAMQPAKGRNSFSMGEARRRLERRGYATVADLKKDGDGVWRGNAQKDGAKVGVWLDYKGNVGQQ